MAGLLSDARLITLVGPGGVGKTRLATELVHQVDLAQIDSTIFCDLTSATDRTVTEVVMAAAAIESRAGQTDLDRLVDVLRHERCCVVLDNCEHVLEQAAIVAELLVEMTDHVVVLATSRERLAVDGEQLVSVPPLRAVRRHRFAGDSTACRPDDRRDRQTLQTMATSSRSMHWRVGSTGCPSLWNSRQRVCNR